MQVEETRFVKHAQVGVGGEAVGAQRDANPAGQEVAKRMRRVAEGSVSARAVDDGVLAADRCVASEIVAVNPELRDAQLPRGRPPHLSWGMSQSARVPDTQLLEK